jgi:uncharacterized membrane protein (UPF0127 family)
MNKLIAALCLVLTSVAAMADMPRMELTLGMYRIDAEVAADQRNRMQGLMNRRSMAPQQGMLFVFTEDNRHCMWMRNTFLPLSVAFLDAQGNILNIEDMEPQTENNHCAAKPARYALEMNKGWFAQKGIKPGVKLTGIEKAPVGQ